MFETKFFNRLLRLLGLMLPSRGLMLHQHKKLLPFVSLILRFMNFIFLLVAFGMLGAVAIDFGLDLDEVSEGYLRNFYNGSFVFFHVVIISRLLFSRGKDRFNLSGFAWIFLGLFFLTLVPVIFHRPEAGPLSVVWDVLRGQTYRVGMMAVISLIMLFGGFLRLLEKRINPTLIMAISFLLIIIMGTGILLMPRCSSGLGFVDAFFLATSAVCVTGMSPVDYTQVLTDPGLVVLLVLFQVGGLGVMTFTSFFTLFFMGNASISSRVMVRDILSENSLNSLLRMLLMILLFTLVIEASGAALIFVSIHGDLGMNLRQELFFSVFHAVSAFCNAGFSSLSDGLGTPMVLYGHAPMFLVISLVVILGGIGFPVLVNLKDSFVRLFRRLYSRLTGTRMKRTRYSDYSLNTRIVLLTTLILLIFSTASFLMLEWNGVLARFPLPERLIHGFFMAVNLRSSGFGAIPTTLWAPASLILLVFLSAIGGASQSTAGGIKVGTLAVALMNIWSVLKSEERLVVYGREFSRASISRCNATILSFIMILLVGVFWIAALEPGKALGALFYECIAALSTCGVSLGITADLSAGSKLVLIVLMFLGRMGVISILIGLVPNSKPTHVRHPQGDIIIS